MTVRVFILGEDPIFITGLCVTVDRADAMNVVGAVTVRDNGMNALQRLEPSPDVVVINSVFPNRLLSDLIQQMTSRHPQGICEPRFLVISGTDDDDALVAALRAGARGYLAKITSSEELLRTIHTVANGGAAFCPVIAPRLSTYFSAVHDLPGRVAFPELTDREREVLDLVAHGLGNRQIARKLVLAEKTVRNHITHIFLKLQVSDRTAAAARARDAGLGV
jgi:DNA-binding NarL/FixJ family response regulator